MSVSLLNEIEVQAERLTRAEKLELARRLLNRAVLSTPSEEATCDLTDLIGLSRGVWESADDVRRYIEEERNAWGS